MRNHLYVAVIGVVSLFFPAAPAQDQPQPKTISDSVNYIWKDLERDFIRLVEAMPEDKWNYKPTQGEFKGVRTFGEQVKHVACANQAWAKQILGEKPPDRCDLGGPNPAKTRAEILQYLRDSFTLMDKVIADTNAENLLRANPGPYWGPNRLSALTAEVWHVSDHYGQLVEYLRLNGIVPPASR
jgi:uncharacterized damage-inducible protein DinB